MTTLNSYATLAEYKSYVTSRGQTVADDTADDAVIETLLKSVSRFFDTQTGRRFYPFIQTRYFDVPNIYSSDPRSIEMDTDLLEVLEITNGDGVVIPSTEYTVQPRNQSPYSRIRLLSTSSYAWRSNSAGETFDVISVNGIWGFHNDHVNAWVQDSALNEDLDATETGVDVVSGSNYLIGDIARYDDEFNYVSSKSTNTLTVLRGVNGSIATTHTSGTGVFLWRFMDDLKTAVLETALQAYKRRFGTSGTNTATVTAAGVVLSPKDVPTIAADFIKTYRRYL
jgi:hypothetical protein